MTSGNSAVGSASRSHDDGPSSASRERKGGLSCAECRRSKLKCDRIFPCQSCQRRGCADLCPDRALQATKGNKVLMARVEKLNKHNKSMAARIKELEIALSEAQLHDNQHTHPLLLAPVKWQDSDELDLVSEVDEEDTSSPPETVDDGAYISPHSQYLKEVHTGRHRDETQAPYLEELGLPPNVMALVNTFPLGAGNQPSSKNLLGPYVPTRDQATQLSNAYFTSVILYQPLWQMDYQAIANSVYDIRGLVNLENVHAHALAVFFVVMCFGSLNEGMHHTADQYHALACAAVSSHSLIQQRSCHLAQALFLINLYKHLSSRPSTEWRWVISGICARVAQGLGLQRDCARWVLPDREEVQRRRVLYWEIFVFESWTGILSSRPPTLTIEQTTCLFPDDHEVVVYNGKNEMSFHAWKYRFAAECMSQAVRHVFSAQDPTYGMLLDVDGSIRDFKTPDHLRTPFHNPPTPWASNANAAMQQLGATIMAEGTLLYLHRAYLPLIGNQIVRQKGGASVWAAFRSASRMVQATESLYKLYPEQLGKLAYFWTAFYISCIALGSIAVDRPCCKLSQHALSILDVAVPLYERASQPTALTATRDILRSMLDRVRREWTNAQGQDMKTQCSDDCCARRSPREIYEFVNGSDEYFPVHIRLAIPPHIIPVGTTTSGSTIGPHPEGIASRLAAARISPSMSDMSSTGSGDFSDPGHHNPYIDQATYSTPPELLAFQYGQDPSIQSHDRQTGPGLVPPTPHQLRFPHNYSPSEEVYAMQSISYPYSLGQSHQTTPYDIGNSHSPTSSQRYRPPTIQQQRTPPPPPQHQQTHSLSAYSFSYHQEEGHQSSFQGQYASSAVHSPMASWPATRG